MKAGNEFYIAKKDHDKLEDGKLYRLMECLNFVKAGNGFKFKSADIEDYKKNGAGIMHWLPEEQFIEADILMPDKETNKGIAELNVKDMDEGEVIQFERFGFCRLDSKRGWRFWYTHS